MPSRISCLIRWSWSPPYSWSVVAAQEIVVGLVVGVQQQQRHPTDLGDPDPRRQMAPAGHRHADRQVFTLAVEHPLDRETLRVVRGVVLLLPAVGGQRLPEIAEPVQQADTDDGHAEIGGGFQMVTGQDAKTARIVGQHLGDAELHREVSDGGRQRLADRHLMLIPPRVLQIMVEICCQTVHPGQERFVPCQFLQPGHRDGAEQFERIALEPGPQATVDIGEKVLARRVPGPSEVTDESTERVQLRGQLRPDGESSESLHGRNLAPPVGYLLPPATCRDEIDDAERAGGLDLA